MDEKRSVDRPSMNDLELAELFDQMFPAHSYEEAAENSGGRFGSAEGVRKAVLRINAFCSKEVAISDEGGKHVVTRAGRQLRDYAQVILKAHREIRVWPPVYHIVIGASHRTASRYLPAFLKHFFDKTDNKNSSLPFQITVRESDSREEFFASLRNGESDLGLRGLPIDRENDQKLVPEDMNATPIGPRFQLFAVSKKRLEGEVSVVRLLAKEPVGILRMDIESVAALLSNAGEQVFFPQKNVLSCESYATMMSFINHSLCIGLIYAPSDVKEISGLHFAKLSDLSSSTQCFTLCKKTIAARLDGLTLPEDRSSWQREHYLAKLRNAFKDVVVQGKAFAQPSDPFDFM